VSGYSDSFIAGHGVLEAGAHLLHKPFTEDSLTRKVRELLDVNRDDFKSEISAPVPVLETEDAGLKR
jgi:hypothetical protein